MDFDRITRISEPTDDLLTLDEVKAHLRVAHDDDDDAIASLIDAATAYIDGPSGCGISLLTQQWRLSLDGFPRDTLRLPLHPVQSVDSITYVPFGGGSPVTLDPATYAVDLDAKPALIARAFFAVFPVTYPQIGAVKITFTSGFGDTADAVPADLPHAAKLLIGHWYENRSAVVGIDSRDSPQDMPFGVAALLSKYRAISFS